MSGQRLGRRVELLRARTTAAVRLPFRTRRRPRPGPPTPALPRTLIDPRRVVWSMPTQ